MFQVLIYSVGAGLFLALLASVIATFSQKESKTGLLENYLLAGGNLQRLPVVSLLVSSSFGINAVFYQIWLGYNIGAWALVAQGAWALSYVWLSRFSGEMRKSKSLHDFISVHFGPVTRVVAAICTLIGFMFLMGWEVEIGKSLYAGLIQENSNYNEATTQNATTWLIVITVIGATIYTIYGGLHGNAWADLFQNLVKILGFSAVFVMLIAYFMETQGSWSHFLAALFPPWSKMVATIGIIGILTNVVFSLSWQFVDASTWQSALAGGKRGESVETSKDLAWSGLAVFITPGILGTILGATLAYTPNITDSNILSTAISVIGGNDFILFVMLFAIAASIMSLIDGLLLASGYALIVDLLHPKSTLEDLDKDHKKAASIVAYLRVAFIFFVFMAIWGISGITSLLGLELFEIVYLVILPQLAILGPVVMGFIYKDKTIYANIGKIMILPIVISFVAGLAATLVGQQSDVSALIDGAGTITALVSLSISFVIIRMKMA